MCQYGRDGNDATLTACIVAGDTRCSNPGIENIKYGHPNTTSPDPYA